MLVALPGYLHFLFIEVASMTFVLSFLSEEISFPKVKS